MTSFVLCDRGMDLGNTEKRFYLAFNDQTIQNAVISVPRTKPIHYDLIFGMELCMIYMNFEESEENFCWVFRKNADNIEGEKFKLTLYRTEFKSKYLHGNVRIFEQKSVLRSTMLFLKGLLATFEAPIRRIELNSTDVVRTVTNFLTPPIITECQTLMMFETPHSGLLSNLISCITIKGEIFTPIPLVYENALEEIQQVSRSTIYSSSHLTVEDVFTLCTIENTFLMPDFTAKELNEFLLLWIKSDEKKTRHVEFLMKQKCEQAFDWKLLLRGFSCDTEMPHTIQECDLRRKDGAIATFAFFHSPEFKTFHFSFFACYPGDEPFVNGSTGLKHALIAQELEKAISELRAFGNRDLSKDYVNHQLSRATNEATILSAERRNTFLRIHLFGAPKTARKTLYLDEQQI